MKLTLLSVMACLLSVSASIGLCQQQTPQLERPYLEHTESPRLYFSMPPTETSGGVQLAASSAQRTLGKGASLSSSKIESVLQLRGNVQVRMCSLSRYGCERGSLLLHANAVDYNENTREIDAHGDVRIIPETRAKRDERGLITLQ